MASSRTFRVIIEDDQFEDGRQAYHAFCPALPGCHTWGYTYEEAQTNIRDAVSLYLEDMLETGEEIPVDPSIQTAETKSLFTIQPNLCTLLNKNIYTHTANHRTENA